MTTESDMVRRKAATMNKGQVLNELARIERAICCVVGEGSLKLYETRLAIFQARLKELLK